MTFQPRLFYDSMKSLTEYEAEMALLKTRKSVFFFSFLIWKKIFISSMNGILIPQGLMFASIQAWQPTKMY